MLKKIMKGENRTIKQLKEHYEIEKELANRLRIASRQERRNLYSLVYDEMYKRVPLHEQLTKKSSPTETKLVVSSQIRLIKYFLGNDITFLEVGPGDCSLSLEVAKFVKHVYAVDVSDEITKNLVCPQNFNLILSDGNSIPLPDNTVNVAYSSHLMEHLHPDDALEQLENIYRSLIPGGVYVCITPNRLTGPHDISKYFDEVATGFHLKEYTYYELICLFRKVGFSRIRIYIGARGNYFRLPSFPSVLYETLLRIIPHVLRKSIVKILPFRLLLGIGVVGTK